MSSHLIYRKKDGKAVRVDSVDFERLLETGEYAATLGTNVAVSKAAAKAASDKGKKVEASVDK